MIDTLTGGGGGLWGVNGADLLESGIILTVFSSIGDKTIQLSGGAHICGSIALCRDPSTRH